MGLVTGTASYLEVVVHLFDIAGFFGGSCGCSGPLRGLFHYTKNVRRFLSSILVNQHGKQGKYYHETTQGVVVPNHLWAIKNHIVPRVPSEVRAAWEKDEVPESLGFTFAAPIPSSEAAPAAGGPENLNLAEQAGDMKGSWALCPVWVLQKQKPSKEGEKQRKARPGHPFLSGDTSSSLARFDNADVAKHSRVLVMGPLVDVKLIEDPVAGVHLHLWVLDDNNQAYVETSCGVPVYSRTPPRLSPATCDIVTRTFGRCVPHESLVTFEGCCHHPAVMFSAVEHNRY